MKLVSIGYLVWLDPWLALISMALFPICIVPVALFGRRDAAARFAPPFAVATAGDRRDASVTPENASRHRALASNPSTSAATPRNPCRKEMRRDRINRSALAGRK